MKVSKWVDFSQEITVEVGADDITVALSEAFYAANQEPDKAVNIHDILGAFQAIGSFLRGFPDQYIDRLNFAQRSAIENFLRTQADRFKIREEPGTANASQPGR
jgi:hypothetical protein